ncbi:uncharacterized [Tachysurus ichikawai]
MAPSEHPSGWAELVQTERAENANKLQQRKKGLRGNSDTTKYGHGSLLHLSEVGVMLAQLCGGGTRSRSRYELGMEMCTRFISRLPATVL